MKKKGGKGILKNDDENTYSFVCEDLLYLHHIDTVLFPLERHRFSHLQKTAFKRLDILLHRGKCCAKELH